VFSNAFLSDRPERPLQLVERPPKPPTPTWTWVERTIERWRTRAFLQAVLDDLKVPNTYELGRILLADEPDRFPFERPAVFETMRKGSPAITKKLKNLSTDDSEAAHWISEALKLAPNAPRVLEEPVWRLLNPRPIGLLEMLELLRPINGLLGGPTLDVVIPDPAGFPEDDIEVRLPTLEPSTRQGLTVALANVRLSEQRGHLNHYYLHLLAAVQRAMQPAAAPCLKALQPQCSQFLATCFGAVLVGDPDISTHKAQRWLMDHALKSYRAATGPQAPNS
jgi:hypothetical protein